MRRLIIFIAVFAVFLAFIAFNLENKCDISFGFKTFKDVPVFLTIFFSFVLGLLIPLPFLLRAKSKSGDTAGMKWRKKETNSDTRGSNLTGGSHGIE